MGRAEEAEWHRVTITVTATTAQGGGTVIHITIRTRTAAITIKIQMDQPTTMMGKDRVPTRRRQRICGNDFITLNGVTGGK
jgi:hypothetical protein